MILSGIIDLVFSQEWEACVTSDIVQKVHTVCDIDTTVYKMGFDTILVFIGTFAQFRLM